MDRPLISVIIPNFNHKSYLKQRIDSVLNQTFQDFELILLDDASTDGSQNIFKDYENHPKVSHVLFNKNNSGSVFKQWIKGINVTKGQYIWIAESDDFANEEFLEATIKTIQSDTKIGLVFTDSIKVDDKGNELGLVSKSKKIEASLINDAQCIHRDNFTKNLLENLLIVNASSVLFRKEALLTIDFDILKTLKNVGDVFTYVRIALNYNLYFLHEPLNFMRLHEHNTTKKNKKEGLIYKDWIILSDHYLKAFNRLSTPSKNSVISFVKSFIFLSIDFGFKDNLLKLLYRMKQLDFLKQKSYTMISFVIFFYSNFMYKGRPNFIREKLKRIINTDTV